MIKQVWKYNKNSEDFNWKYYLLLVTLYVYDLIYWMQVVLNTGMLLVNMCVVLSTYTLY